MSLLWRVKRSWPGGDVVLIPQKRHQCGEEGIIWRTSGPPYWSGDHSSARSLLRGDLRQNVSVPRSMTVDIAEEDRAKRGRLTLRRERQDSGSAPDSDQIAEYISQVCGSPAGSRFRLALFFFQLVPLFPLSGVAVEGDVETPTPVFVLEGQAGVLLPILHSDHLATPRTGTPPLLDDLLHELYKRFSLFGVVQVPPPPR